MKEYDDSMSALFKEAPEYITGPNNVYLLNSSLSSSFPELSFVDPNDNNWKLSSLEKKSYPLDEDGRLFHASVSGFGFYKIKKPQSVPLEKACTDPKYIMDLILENLRTERTLRGSDKYRILSFGAPSSTGEYRDALGRTWITAYWSIGFDDKVLIMYILPMPNGPALITTIQNSSVLFDYEWDLRKTCEHVNAGYDAAFSDWVEFMSLKKYIPGFFSDLRFEWDSNARSFNLNTGSFSIRAGRQVFDWVNDSELFLAPSWYRQKSKPEFGVRKTILYRDIRGKEFVVLYRNIKPDPKLGTSALENWNDLVTEKFPFDERPAISAKDNTGIVGAIVKAQAPDPDVLYTLYLSMTDPLNEENLNQRFSAIIQGVSIRE
jgi:hypothetical protein